MWTRNTWCATGFLLVLAAATAGMLGAQGPREQKPHMIPIEDCRVEFVNKSTYATARPGIIAELPFEEGDHVQKGDLVVRLRDEVALANLKYRQLQADLETPVLIAEQELRAAEMEYQSHLKANSIYESLVPVTTTERPFPQTDIDRLEIITTARKLQVRQAREELTLSQVASEEAQAELETYRVHANFGGLVTNVEKHVGEAVNLGDNIITIVDTSRVRVEGTLPYHQARRLRVGDPVRISLSFPQERRPASRTNGEPDAPLLPEEKEIFSGQIGFIGVDVP
ncbi:MAG: HlyD family efflux transporter periplasmic adaptor subunit, partial [Planctomycetaceae bacterium]|nr:HlyD family efflux transporter periplasmic adaptor subunit [Planctomycetaceae bacterium]